MMLAAAGPAAAHPHVFVTATSEIVHDGAGRLGAVRHAWTFDEMFSAFAIQGLDANGDGTLSREELQPLAQVNVESLKEFGYFTRMKLNGAPVALAEPVDYWLSHDGTALTLHFTLPVETPAAIGRKALALEVYDPSYFVAFAFAESEPVRLAAAPAGCKLDIHRPEAPDPGLAAQLQDDEILMEMTDPGAMFANRALVNCP